ncbi:MAG: glycosyltransferase [Myxococcales bacterium]|nr:glycosyltransferase [Myxococcales bacterium]MCB9715264.1 glycosyltransferase [Myxococcales bacterium]
MDDRGLGICVIGRNESARLHSSLSSLDGRGEHRVYVDSDSTDDSVAIARCFEGFEVVQITERQLCTAARGRNLGFARLRAHSPELRFVQFVDGDCVITQGWLDVAMATLRERPEVAIVAGRLREHYRDRNVYHRLADMEWGSGGVGEVDSVGGIFMIRAEVFAEVGGMNPWMAQGEEAELARRVRGRGHRVVRLPDEMGHHDIAIERFGQWWTRAVREGRATAESVRRNGLSDHHSIRHLISMAFWGAGLPTAAATLVLPSLGLSSGLLAGYGMLWHRVRRHRMELGDTPEDASLYASATVLGKIANATGVAGYLRDVLRRQLGRG